MGLIIETEKFQVVGKQNKKKTNEMSAIPYLFKLLPFLRTVKS